jgi:hypothetical protein
LLTAVGVHGPIIGPLTLLFLLFGPGSVLAWLLPGIGGPVRLVIAVFGGLALDTVVAEGMLVTRTWAIGRGADIVLLVTTVVFLIGTILRDPVREAGQGHGPPDTASERGLEPQS